MVLAAHDHASESALSGVVVQRDAGITQEARQPGPQPHHVRDRLTEAARGQRPLPERPGPDRVDDRNRLLPPCCASELPRVRARLLTRRRAGRPVRVAG